MSAAQLSLAVLGLGLLVGCDTQEKPQGTTGSSRSEAVRATAPQASATATPHAPATPNAPRKLCASAPQGAGKPLPSSALSTLVAGDEPALESRLQDARGRWTWVNFWAAWCGPCKEEIPLLKGFADSQAKAGKPIQLAFVSLDDDERQAKQFLESQPKGGTGLRASHWLRDGAERQAFLAPLKVLPDAGLPLHLLFDPSGALRCRIDGAVEASDLPVLEALFAKP